MKPLRSIESLRAYMAWWVVIGHGLHLIGVGGATTPGFLALVPDRVIGLLLRGDVAVFVFVIVSGFVITHLLLTRQEPYRVYITRRALRLFPVYGVCLGAALLLGPLYALAYVDSGLSFGGDMRAARIASESQYWPQHLLLHLTLLHGAVPDTALPYAGSAFLAPAWSLSLEWQFYLIAPLLLPLLALRSLNTLVVTVATLTLLGLVLHRQTGFQWQYDSLFFLASSYFLVGMLCRIVIERINQNRSFFEVLLLAALLLLTVDRLAAAVWLIWFGIILYESGHMQVQSQLLRRAIVAVGFGARISRLGQYSYATYLAHIPVFTAVVGGYALVVGPANMAQGVVAALVLGCCPVIVIVSARLHRFVEKPAIEVGRRWFATPLQSSKPNSDQIAPAQ